MPMPFSKYKPYETVPLPDRTWPDTVVSQAPIWCSTDLRDGNQALVNPMDTHRKRRFFALLLELGFTEIEVGFPAASKADFDFVRTLVEEERIAAFERGTRNVERGTEGRISVPRSDFRVPRLGEGS